jgi:uncharacterized repeat protein (TIGR03803 family)
VKTESNLYSLQTVASRARWLLSSALLFASLLGMQAQQAGCVLTDFYEVGSEAASGSGPEGGLVQGSDGNLYGAMVTGGTNGAGTIFQITLNGVLTPLYSFGGGTNGSRPVGSLVQGSDGNLYGTTSTGGDTNYNPYPT